MHRVSILVVVFVALVGISTFAEENCGQRFHDQDFASTKGKPEIVGGKDAVRGAYPWQVRLRVNELKKEREKERKEEKKTKNRQTGRKKENKRKTEGRKEE